MTHRGAGRNGQPAHRGAGRDAQVAYRSEDHDPVEWMRRRWQDRDEPLPEYFAAMAALLRTSILLTDELDRVLRDGQLTRTGYLILITLQMSDGHTRPLGQLSRALLVHPTTVTLAVDQLARDGLVRRMPHPSDRRTILAKLTLAGVDAASSASAALADACYGLRGLSASGARRLTTDLSAVRSGLGDLAAPPGSGESRANIVES